MKEGHYVHLLVEAEDKGYWQVKERESFTYETGTSDTAEFASVAAGSESGFKNIKVLEPEDLPPHLLQIRWGIQDGFNYYLKIPTGTNRLGLDQDKDVGFINNWKSPYYAPNEEFEFWLVWGYYPSINAKSEREHNQVAGTPKIWFEGMKYAIKEVKENAIIQAIQNFEAGRPGGIPVRKVVIGGLIGGT